MDKKEYFLNVKGKVVKVNEAIYRAYWKITEHEKYLQRKDWKYNVLPFSVFDYDLLLPFARKREERKMADN